MNLVFILVLRLVTSVVRLATLVVRLATLVVRVVTLVVRVATLVVRVVISVLMLPRFVFMAWIAAKIFCPLLKTGMLGTRAIS